MNTIIPLVMAAIAGLASGLLRAVLGSRVARDAKHVNDAEPEPVNELDAAPERETFDAEHAADLAEWNEELARLRAPREKDAAERAAELRSEYLASRTGRHRQDATEVPA